MGTSKGNSGTRISDLQMNSKMGLYRNNDVQAQLFTQEHIKQHVAYLQLHVKPEVP
jgi:hypothetical protein